MFYRNGFVMRTAYPLGFAGEEVDICPTLRFFAAGIWRKTMPFLQKAWEFFLNHILGPGLWFPTVTIGTMIASLYGVCSRGVFLVYSWSCDDQSSIHPREIRIPFLYKIGNVQPIPMFWVAVGMLTWCLISVFPLILAMRSESVGFSLVFEWVMATFFPWGMWVILNGRLNRERLAKRTAEFAPFLAQPLEELPFIRNTGEVVTLFHMSIVGWRKMICIKVKVTD